MSPTIQALASSSSSEAPPTKRGRAVRKSAKAAAAFLAATIKEETPVDDQDDEASVSSDVTPPKKKRSYTRRPSSLSSATRGASPQHHSGESTNRGRGIGALSSKKKTALSSFAVEYLKAWMMSPNHIEHPYPSEDEKINIMNDTGIELKQLTNWFVNNRKRYWKPKVEELRKKSNKCSLTLQEVAAREQGGNGCLVTMARANCSGMVSSESEGSLTVEGGTGKRTYTKKRKKYSTLEKEMPPKKSTRRSYTKKSKIATSSTTKTIIPSTSQIGIHTANSHESMKASRRLSTLGRTRQGRRVSQISETESSGESDSDFTRGTKKRKIQGGVRGQGKVLIGHTQEVEETPAVSVSNPLASNPLEQTTLTARVSGSGNTVEVTPAYTSQALPVSSSSLGAGLPLTTSQVADLDYTINGDDTQELALGSSHDDLVENVLGGGMLTTTTASSAAASVPKSSSSVVVCSSVNMPHSCNLSDPNAMLCALCSACRDWNQGEFCPWDLTGILGADEPTSSDASSSVDDSAAEEATTLHTKSSSLDFDAATVVSDVPHEKLGHSTSALDFQTTMADIETW